MNSELLKKEISFQTSRSGGKGGQNVNKVETKAEAWWLPATSQAVSEEERQLLLHKLEQQLNKEGWLMISAASSRSQLQNKEEAVKKLLDLIKRSLVVPKKRKATKPSRSSVEKRLFSKKKNSERKINRKPPIN